MELAQGKEISNKLIWLTKYLKYMYLIDNLFNYTEKGIGIIILAKKEAKKE